MEQKLLSKELHRSARKRFQTRRTVTTGIGDLYQADLVDMIKLSKFNKGFKYYLAVIDTFSKMGYAEPLKTKKAVEVRDAFERILERSNVVPKLLQTDQGTEFFNKDFGKLMEKHGINHYNTWTDKKAAIVERWNRTIKEKLWRLFTEKNTVNWIDMIQDVVEEYNGKKHASIGMAPSTVNKTNADLVLQRLGVSKTPIKKPKFKVGQWVRTSRWQKNIFSKSYEGNFSEELFQIVTVKNTVPTVYVLENIHGQKLEGTYYELELQATKIPDYFRIGKILQRRTNKDGSVDIKVTKKGYDQRYFWWIPLADTEKLSV